MANDYDAIVTGSGLGGLTAGALYARAGNRVLVLNKTTGLVVRQRPITAAP